MVCRRGSIARSRKLFHVKHTFRSSHRAEQGSLTIFCACSRKGKPTPPLRPPSFITELTPSASSKSTSTVTEFSFATHDYSLYRFDGRKSRPARSRPREGSRSREPARHGREV